MGIIQFIHCIGGVHGLADSAPRAARVSGVRLRLGDGCERLDEVPLGVKFDKDALDNGPGTIDISGRRPCLDDVDELPRAPVLILDAPGDVQGTIDITGRHPRLGHGPMHIVAPARIFDALGDG